MRNSGARTSSKKPTLPHYGLLELLLHIANLCSVSAARRPFCSTIWLIVERLPKGFGELRGFALPPEVYK